MPKVTDRPLIIFLSAVVGAFIAGVSCYLFLSKSITDETTRAVERLELSGKLPRGPQGPAGPEAASLPVGTVIASFVPPSQFLTTERKAQWVLAEGQIIPGGSAFHSLVTASPDAYASRDRLPDLRGMFLRGMNEGRTDEHKDTDGLTRKSGGFQDDAFEAHSHKLGDSAHAGSGDPRAWSAKAGNLDFESAKTGGSETRPKNIGVYYYVKIN